MITLLMQFTINCKLNKKNILGKTALDIAKQKNNQIIIGMFDDEFQNFLSNPQQKSFVLYMLVCVN